MMKHIVLYTDGACQGNPGPGGYGVVLMYKDQRKELSGGYKLTTNNRMEMMAVIKGLEILKEPCSVDLYSDSRYVVDAIEKGWVFKWKKNNWLKSDKSKALNIDLWEKILCLFSVHKVKCHWVKGHADNVENERCDFLGREYIKTGELSVDEVYISEQKK